MSSRGRTVLGVSGLFLASSIVYAVAVQLYDPSCTPHPPLRLSRPARIPDAPTIALLGDTALTEANPDDALEPTSAFLGDADLSIANLEAPITGRTEHPWRWKEYRYRSELKWASALARAGLDVATLANNHMFDYSDRGVTDTIEELAKHGVGAAGAGDSLALARRGLVATVGDVRVAVLAYCERQWLWNVYVGQFALPSRTGVAPLSEHALSEDIARLRTKADVVIVALHGGRNYAPLSASMRRFAERAVDFGADLVVAHHSHTAGAVSVYRGKPILSGLGNYVFGTPGHPDLSFGLMARVTLRRHAIARVDLFALDVQNRRVAYRPRPLDGSALEEALTWLIRESAALGTTVERSGDHAVLTVAKDAT